MDFQKCVNLFLSYFPGRKSMIPSTLETFGDYIIETLKKKIIFFFLNIIILHVYI